MKSAYQILRKPVITEKGLGVKETEGTLVFEVAFKATKPDGGAFLFRLSLSPLIP